MPLTIGVTAGGVLVPVQVDASGVVIVDQVSALPAGTNNIGDVDVLTLPALPAGTNLLGAVRAWNYGLVGGSFQKDPIRFGYSDVVSRYFYNTSLAAGTAVIADTAVPAGEIWVITNITASMTSGSITKFAVRIQTGAVNYILYQITTPTTLVHYDRQGWWVMKPTDLFRCVVYNATLNDDFYCYATGFRVDIDQ